MDDRDVLERNRQVRWLIHEGAAERHERAAALHRRAAQHLGLAGRAGAAEREEHFAQREAERSERHREAARLLDGRFDLPQNGLRSGS